MNAAEMCLRRLANRHGHTKDGCPDPKAHKLDVADMALALEAAGFVPYVPKQPKARISSTLIPIRRPGQ